MEKFPLLSSNNLGMEVFKRVHRKIISDSLKVNAPALKSDERKEDTIRLSVTLFVVKCCKL